MMALLVLVNLTNVMAEFAGVASSLELFRISRYISVPLAALPFGSWSSRATTRAWRRSSSSPASLYVAYIISGILVKPDWKEAALYSVRPGADAGARLHLHADRHGGHHDRAVDAVLPAGGGGGEGHYGEGVRGVADRSDRRLHHDVGDRVLHHRGVRGRHLDGPVRATSRTRRRRRSA